MRRSLSQDGLLPRLVLVMVLGLGFGCSNQNGASAGDGPPQSGQDAGVSDDSESGGRDAANQDAAASRADAPGDSVKAGGLPDAAAPSCASAFAAAVAQDCSSAADCVLVNGDDCCGRVKIAIKAGTQ